MWRVTEGNKIRNVTSNAETKNYYAGDTLPEDYIPHETYIQQNIVEEIKTEKKTKKIGGDF